MLKIKCLTKCIVSCKPTEKILIILEGVTHIGVESQQHGAATVVQTDKGRIKHSNEVA